MDTCMSTFACSNDWEIWLITLSDHNIVHRLVNLQRVVCLSLRATGPKSARWSSSRQLYDPEIKPPGQSWDDKELEDQIPFGVHFSARTSTMHHAAPLNSAGFSGRLGAFEAGDSGDNIVPHHAAVLTIAQQQPLQAVSLHWHFYWKYFINWIWSSERRSQKNKYSIQFNSVYF